MRKLGLSYNWLSVSKRLTSYSRVGLVISLLTQAASEAEGTTQRDDDQRPRRRAQTLPRSAKSLPRNTKPCPDRAQPGETSPALTKPSGRPKKAASKRLKTQPRPKPFQTRVEKSWPRPGHLPEAGGGDDDRQPAD